MYELPAARCVFELPNQLTDFSVFLATIDN